MRQINTIGICVLLLAKGANAGLVKDDFNALVDDRNLGLATLGLGAAGVAHNWDDNAKDGLERVFSIGSPADFTNIYGASSFNLPMSFGLWGFGKVSGRPQLRRTGSALLRTLALTQLVVGPIKFAVRRERPDGSNRRSFPSGHTANGFAIARLLHRSYGRPVGIPLYLVAGFVGAGRIEHDRHFFSDVVMGAVLGTIVGNSVTLDTDERLGVVPVMMGSRLTLMLRVRL